MIYGAKDGWCTKARKSLCAVVTGGGLGQTVKVSRKRNPLRSMLSCAGRDRSEPAVAATNSDPNCLVRIGVKVSLGRTSTSLSAR